MLYLVRIELDTWSIYHSDLNFHFEGTLWEMMDKMEDLGVPARELDRAFEDMSHKAHNKAVFGKSLRFLFSEHIAMNKTSNLAA